MQLDQFEELYYDLFHLAWNAREIKPNNKHLIKTVSVAAEIFNDYKIEGNISVKRVLMYLKTTISIHKARNNYLCTNNSEHKINKSDSYARIFPKSSGPKAELGTMCLPCAAKILFVILTNFPPVEDGECMYVYPSNLIYSRYHD